VEGAVFSTHVINPKMYLIFQLCKSADRRSIIFFFVCSDIRAEHL